VEASESSDGPASTEPAESADPPQSADSGGSTPASDSGEPAPGADAAATATESGEPKPTADSFPTAADALRRSLLVWGSGQLASGDPRGWLGPPAQVAAIAGLLLIAPLAAGTAAPVVFVLAAAFVAAWAAVGVHAWTRAARRRQALGLDPGGGGEALLWLVPLVLAVGAGLWVAGGSGADPALALDAYLGDWRAGRAEAGAARFAASPPSPTVVRSAWERQLGRLHNAVVRIVAAEPAVLADPNVPLDGLRWVDLGPLEGGGRQLGLEAARHERVENLLLGILPATSQRLVPVERLGTAELRPVAVSSGFGPFGPVVAWRLVRIEILGEVLAAG
jgi:hypothetical protein